VKTWAAIRNKGGGEHAILQKKRDGKAQVYTEEKIRENVFQKRAEYLVGSSARLTRVSRKTKSG